MSTSSDGTRQRPWTFIKLGGSLITDKSGHEQVREETVAMLARELATAADTTGARLVVGHGSGSFGHVAAARHDLGSTGRRAGAASIAAVQDAAARLHRRVIAALLEAGARAFSLAPASFMVAAEGSVAGCDCEALVLASDAGLLPIVYGDVACDRVRGATILATETVFVALAECLGARGERVSEVLWLGETDGVYDEAGRTVPDLGPNEADRLASSVAGAAGTDVTGGMGLRLRTAALLARLGVESRILDGRVAGQIRAALRGEAVGGTVVRRA